ncbi:MAG: PAS domain S-box protein [Myxococcales bacterium]|nr:PAS domain S-box protein [Myxococcales bacterium]
MSPHVQEGARTGRNRTNRRGWTDNRYTLSRRWRLASTHSEPQIVSRPAALELLVVTGDQTWTDQLLGCAAVRASRLRLSVCSTLAEARAALQERAPDVVLIALRLRDGPWTALWANGRPERPCVVLVDAGDASFVTAALERGAIDYLVGLAALTPDIPRVVERALAEWQRVRAAEPAGHAAASSEASASASQDAEKLYRDVLDAAPALVYVFDVAGRCALVNKRVRDFMERPERELLGRTRAELGLTPRSIEEHREYDQDVILRGAPRSYKERNVDPRGRELVYLTHKFPLYDREGEVFGVGGISTDITAQERAVEELMESEARFRRAFETTGHGMALVSPEGHFIKVNQTFCDIVGLTVDEMLEIDFQRITHPDDLRLDLEHVQRLLRGEIDSYKLEKRYIHQRGHVVWVILSVSLVRDAGGGALYFVSQVIDITDRKKVEEALAESEHKYRSLTANFPDSVVRFDRARRHLFANSVASAALGRRVQDLLDRTHRELGLPDDACALLEAVIDAVFETGETRVAIIEVALGEPRTMEWRCSPEFGADGSVASVLGIARDITEKRRMEEKLLASQKMDSIGNLAGGVAHDFNNMLSVILGQVELALGDLDPADPLHAGLGEVRRAAQRSADLTRQLLGFARQQPMQPRVLDLNETVGDMLKMLRRLIGEHIALRWEPHREPMPVLADPTQVDQVLANLCVNARDAIGDGGTVTIATGCVEFGADVVDEYPHFQPGRYVVLTVADDGCGVDEATRAKIFEPFFTTKELGQGTGLGLSTVYGIVRQNGGFADVDSVPGEGATFRIYLPRHIPAPEELPQAKAQQQVKDLTGHERILLVEDEESVRAFSARALATTGYEVFEAGSGEEALEVLEEIDGEIDLLISDVVMPEMDGPTLFKELRKTNPSMKVIFVSGYPNEAFREQLGSDDFAFLPKPFSLPQLAMKVKEELAK